MISVIIPSYNYAHFLRETVQSVANQSYSKIELVIVDDASKDDSQDVIEELEQAYSERFINIVTAYHVENKGAHQTINEGIELATGDWIAILNADDLYESNRFSRMKEELKKAHTQLAFSAVQCIGIEGERLATEQAQAFEAIQQLIKGKNFMALSAVGENVAISTGNLLFQKSLYRALNGFRNYQYVHDYDFFLRACLITEPVFVEDTNYQYRLHGENTFTKLKKEGVRENRMVWLDFYRDIRKGVVENSQMLLYDDYQQQMYEAVRAMGWKKEFLWQVSTNVGVRAVLKQLKRKYAVESVSNGL